MWSKWIISICYLLPVSAYAHAGHGVVDSQSYWHALLEWQHSGWVIPVVGIIGAFVLLYLSLNKNSAYLERRDG